MYEVMKVPINRYFQIHITWSVFISAMNWKKKQWNRFIYDILKSMNDPRQNRAIYKLNWKIYYLIKILVTFKAFFFIFIVLPGSGSPNSCLVVIFQWSPLFTISLGGKNMNMSSFHAYTGPMYNQFSEVCWKYLLIGENTY